MIRLTDGDRILCTSWRQLKKVYMAWLSVGGNTYRRDLHLYSDGEWEDYYGDYPAIEYDEHRKFVGCESVLRGRSTYTVDEFLHMMGVITTQYSGSKLVHNFII
jgi:hypothetical protein